MSAEMVELPVSAPEPVRPAAGILQQNRVFLDFFWDLAKPDQEVRLRAVENLIQYLKSNKVRHITVAGDPAWLCRAEAGPVEVGVVVVESAVVGEVIR